MTNPAAAPVMTGLGFPLYLDASDPLGLGQNQAIYEAQEIATCRALVRPGDRVLDVGANIGYYSVLLAQLAGPGGQVLALEPDPANFALLQRNVQLNGCGTVTALALALSDTPGSAALFPCEFNTGMHRLYPSVCCTPDSLSVTAARGDDLLREALQGSPVDFIKMDIEGHELHALHGLRHTLHTHGHNLALLVEFSPLALLEAGSNPADLLHLLAGAGLRLLAWEGEHLQETAVSTLLDAIQVFTPDAFKTYLAACQGLDKAALWTHTAAYLAQTGYTRPYFESLLWLGAARSAPTMATHA